MKNPALHPLLTDWYQVTMASAWLRDGRGRDEAVFDLFFRRAPFGGRFAIACGVEGAIEWLLNFEMGDDEIAWLRDEGRLGEQDAERFRGLRFTGEVLAAAEGTAMFPHVPLMRVRAPIVEAQLVETALLNRINFETLIATKAARIVNAAAGDPVVDFGLRRAQGPDGAVSASRAAYVGGCVGTSNVLAARLFGIPLKGTHAHSWVMAHETELDAFRAYARAFPDAPLFLVDTYDTIESGIPNALIVLNELREAGHAPRAAIRLDSGDLAQLSITSARMLEVAGYDDPIIVASSDLDEDAIIALKKSGARINAWGVGTRLVTGHSDPALGGVYKLAAIERDGKLVPCEKRSDDPEKATLGGVKVPVRWLTRSGALAADVIHFEGDAPVHGHRSDAVGGRTRTGVPVLREAPVIAHHLLREVIRDGQRVCDPEPLDVIRDRAATSLRFMEREEYGASHVLLVSTSAF